MELVLHINGKEYRTGNHGFTRNSLFTCSEHDDSHVVMVLKDSEATLREYPFRFTLQITYTLNGDRLDIRYDITNENDVTMPFNFGLHPAFNCPIEPEKDFFDYHIEFNTPETFRWKVTELNNETVLPLNKDALAETVIITDPKSTVSTLTDGIHGVSVGYENYEWLAFWSPQAPFVCIEPWYGLGDPRDFKGEFKDKPLMNHLLPGASFMSRYTITIG